jgi:hypothetical protein
VAVRGCPAAWVPCAAASTRSAPAPPGPSRCSSRSRTKGPALSGSPLRSRTPLGQLPAVVALILGALAVLAVLAPDSAASVGQRVSELVDERPPADTPLTAHATAASWVAASRDHEGSGRDAAEVDSSDAPSDEAPVADGGEAEAERTEDPAPQLTTPFGRVDDLELLLPSVESVVAGFHQSSTREALSMTPVGEQHVLPSRGRGTAPTSAVDIVLVDDDPVLSPVSGTIETVASFELYGRHADRRVTIVPDDAPHLRVVVIHVAGVQVAAGDRVEAGTTRLADGARRFPFRSQIDDLTDPDAWPHVHLEVRRSDSA